MDDSSNQAPTRKGAPPPGPKKPPPMSPAELEAFIKRSPKHKKVVALYTPILVMGGLSTLLAAVVIGTSCGWGECARSRGTPAREADRCGEQVWR